jgi:hypothetical protein
MGAEGAKMETESVDGKEGYENETKNNGEGGIRAAR